MGLSAAAAAVVVISSSLSKLNLAALALNWHTTATKQGQSETRVNRDTEKKKMKRTVIDMIVRPLAHLFVQLSR